jgi:hypothetical protein
MMTVIDLKKRTKPSYNRPPPRDLMRVTKASGPGRYFSRITADIHSDPGAK